MNPERSPTASLSASVHFHVTQRRLTRDLERKVQASEHDSDEDPPPEYGRREGESPGRNLQVRRADEVPVVRFPEGAGEHAEAEDEGEEDHEEADVCAEGADEVDEAEDCHGDEEECWVGGQYAFGLFGVG
jgi:hypothetical protein